MPDRPDPNRTVPWTDADLARLNAADHPAHATGCDWFNGQPCNCGGSEYRTDQPATPRVDETPLLTLTKAMTEDQLLTAITDAATYLGWRWHHVRRSDKALQMGDQGFPDLVLARSGTVLFLELKNAKNGLRPGQYEWLRAINGRSGVAQIAHIVRPADLDRILEMLK